MFFPARPISFILFLLATINLVACEAADATPTPRPTWTPRVIVQVITPSPEPTETPEATATLSPTRIVTPTTAAVPRIASSAPAANDPLLPKFGAFPPLPIPSRPSNINPLTGLQADPATLQRRPIVARIGNDQIVRTSNWHSGLSLADLVFEELIDTKNNVYANTRYSAVYLSNDAPIIGPIRSGRIINFQMTPMLDGALVHAGASNGTRWLFSQSPMINLDEYFNQPAYCYDKTHGYQGRLYTSAPRLREWLQQKKWEAPVPLFGFNFADRAPGGTPATLIGINKAPWPSWDALQWRYDAASGKYLRFTTGNPHMDTVYNITAKWGNGADCVSSGNKTQTQIRASNVVVLYAHHQPTEIIEDDNNYVSVYINLVGQGDATFFRDGVMAQGKWKRNSEQEFFQFTDASGNSFALKPGNTWFEIVPLGYQLEVK